jgi:hypothetical protein
MIKVAFDFDDTLDQEEVQEYAKSLISLGIDVWICTARYSNQDGNPNWNTDLFETMMALRIPWDRVIFSGGGNKSFFLKDKGFIWLLDDMHDNITDLCKNSKVIPILYVHYNPWMDKCNSLIKKAQDEKGSI